MYIGHYPIHSRARLITFTVVVWILLCVLPTNFLETFHLWKWTFDDVTFWRNRCMKRIKQKMSSYPARDRISRTKLHLDVCQLKVIGYAVKNVPKSKSPNYQVQFNWFTNEPLFVLLPSSLSEQKNIGLKSTWKNIVLRKYYTVGLFDFSIFTDGSWKRWFEQDFYYLRARETHGCICSSAV